MNRDRKRERRRNVFSILGLLALLMYILQLWPVLVLILSGMVVYVFWLLFHLEKETVQPAPPMPPPAPPKPDVPVSEETVLDSAFVLLQRRITEQVTKQYPEGRWIWSVSNARERFANGEALRIMLNRAGGYQSALVQVHNLQFCGLDGYGLYGGAVGEIPGGTGTGTCRGDLPGYSLRGEPGGHPAFFGRSEPLSSCHSG